MRLGSQSLPHTETPPRMKYVSLGARGKEIVMYQLLKCISTKQGRGESGPGGTGGDHSAAQAAVLRQRRLWRPSILPFLGLGSPSAGIQQEFPPLHHAELVPRTWIIMPSSVGEKGFVFCNIQCWLTIKNSVTGWTEHQTGMSKPWSSRMAAGGCKTVVPKTIAFLFPAPWEDRLDGPFSGVPTEVHRDQSLECQGSP